MAVTVKFNLRGARALGNRLNQFVRELGGNRTELHQRFGIQALRWIDKNFQAEGGLLSDGKWKPLADSTVRGRRRGKRKIKTQAQRRRYRARILQDTGRLRQSFTMRATNSSVTVGTAVPYAVYHESDAPRKVLPRRRMLPKFEELAPQLLVTAANYIEELKRRGEGL